MTLNVFKNLDSASLAKVATLAIISLPLAFVYACWKANQTPAEIPLTIEQRYPDEHLGI